MKQKKNIKKTNHKIPHIEIVKKKHINKFMFHRRLPCYFVSLKCRSADCLKVMMKVSTFGYNLKATGCVIGTLANFSWRCVCLSS